MQTDIQLPILGKDPPSEYRLFVFGANLTAKGTIYLTKESAQQIMAAFYARGNVLTFNVEHEEIPGFTPGHFKLELRDDGIWMAPIQWTEKGAEKVKSGELVFTSPELRYNENNEVIEITRVALTNNPATDHLKPLALSLGNFSMDDQATMMSVHPFKQILNSMQACMSCAQSTLSSDNGLMADEHKQVLTDGVKMMADYSTRLMEGLEKMGVEKGDEKLDDDGSEEMSMKSPNQNLSLTATNSEAEKATGTILALSKNLESIEEKVKKLEAREVELLVDLGIAHRKISPNEKNLYLSLSKTQVEAFLEKRTAAEPEQRAKEIVAPRPSTMNLSVPAEDLLSMGNVFKKLGFTDGHLINNLKGN